MILRKRLNGLRRARQEAIRESDRARLAKINEALIKAERQFIDPKGLRGRPWYKHQIYAPGFYTGYAAQPLTDFRQALDDRNAAMLRNRWRESSPPSSALRRH